MLTALGGGLFEYCFVRKTGNLLSSSALSTSSLIYISKGYKDRVLNRANKMLFVNEGIFLNKRVPNKNILGGSFTHNTLKRL